MQMASLPHTSSYNPNVNTDIQSAAQNNAQFMTGWQTNPCSGIMTYIVNLPASFFDTGNGNAPQPISLNISLQPVSASNQDSASNAQPV